MNTTHVATDHAAHDTALRELDAPNHDWARVAIAERRAILSQIKDALRPVVRESDIDPWRRKHRLDRAAELFVSEHADAAQY